MKKIVLFLLVITVSLLSACNSDDPGKELDFCDEFPGHNDCIEEDFCVTNPEHEDCVEHDIDFCNVNPEHSDCTANLAVFLAAIDQFKIEFDSFDQLDVKMDINIDEMGVYLTSSTYVTNDVAKNNSFVLIELDTGDIEYESIEYIKELENSYLLYTSNPNIIDQYIAYELETYYSEDEMSVDILFNNNYTFVDDSTISTKISFSDISDDYGVMFEEVIEGIGLVGDETSYSDTLVEVSFSIDDDKEIENILFDYTDVFEDVIENMCSAEGVECIDYELITAVMTMTFGYHNLGEIVLPTNIIYDDNYDNLSDDFEYEKILLGQKLIGFLEYSGDTDTYELEILEEGYYYFDITDDILIDVQVNPSDYSYIFYENYIYPMLDINSRKMYLTEGTYIITINNLDLNTITPKSFSITVESYTGEDDFDDVLLYDQYHDIDILSFGTVYLKNNYTGDIDTLYLPYDQRDVFIKISKDVMIIDAQNANLRGIMEFEDYYFILFSYLNPGSYQMPSWSFSFINLNLSSVYYTIQILDPYIDRADFQNLGPLLINEENLLHSFEQCVYTLSVTQAGYYNFSYLTTENASLDFDIFADSNMNDYIISIYENDQSIYLEAGMYYLHASSNFSTMGIFKLIITKE